MALTIFGNQQDAFLVYKITMQFNDSQFVYVGFTHNYFDRMKRHVKDKRRMLCQVIEDCISYVEPISHHNTKDEARAAEAALIRQLSCENTFNLLNTHHNKSS